MIQNFRRIVQELSTLEKKKNQYHEDNIIFSSKLSLFYLDRQAFEAADDTAAVKINLAKKEVELDTDLTVEEICEIIDNAGYTFSGLELI